MFAFGKIKLSSAIVYSRNASSALVATVACPAICTDVTSSSSTALRSLLSNPETRLTVERRWRLARSFAIENRPIGRVRNMRHQSDPSGLITVLMVARRSPSPGKKTQP